MVDISMPKMPRVKPVLMRLSDAKRQILPMTPAPFL
jgi:hypothetical protein